MAIDKSGDWWIGSSPDDIQEFLTEWTTEEDGYVPSVFRRVRCDCGSEEFEFERAGDIVRRTCAKCSSNKFICRTSEDWEEAEEEEGSEPFSCVECDGTKANLVIGFALYDDQPEIDGVKWFYVGVRCALCGILGSFCDGKIGWGPKSDVYKTI
jgi:hypothetical protein